MMGCAVCSVEQEAFQHCWSCLLLPQCPARELFSELGEKQQESCCGMGTLERHGFGLLCCSVRMFSHTLKRDRLGMTETVMALCPPVQTHARVALRDEGQQECGGSWILPGPCIGEAAADREDLRLSSAGVRMWIEGKEPRDQLVAPGLISLFVMIKP